MSINFEINERVNQILASTKDLPDDAPIPGIHKLIADVIRALDPTPSLEEIKAELDADRLPAAEWSVHNGPAIYALSDSFLDRFRPAIVWVGQTEHMKRRVRQHQRQFEKDGCMPFDGVRGVFIEDAGMRRLIERKALAYFKAPKADILRPSKTNGTERLGCRLERASRRGLTRKKSIKCEYG